MLELYLFIPQSAGVCRLSTSKVMGLILLKLNPMSFSSKDLKHENEPDLFMCGCLLSPCIITCISLVCVLHNTITLTLTAVRTVKIDTFTQ